MTNELAKITADIAFYDEVLAAIAAAGAKRQALTHEPHRFTHLRGKPRHSWRGGIAHTAKR
ncbi:hypothetical protein V0M98_37085 (plasmid) [Pseudomonas silesiensis]|uniref:hypothetical protein n=1 Tax=Pseudomonas silesiensis TaxID=1853130 RepID=UPI0030D51C87